VRAVDTNVLDRYMAADEPQQTRLAEHFIEACGKQQETIFIPILVLCELVWVLERSYRNSKAGILAALDQILETDLFAIENDSLVRRSIEEYRIGKGNFADYLIGNAAKHAGCSDTVTFDRALAGAQGFTLLR
jgi:predicted nucleic-acid-binding protein